MHHFFSDARANACRKIELRRRIRQRKGDASEANLEVLERQLETREPLGDAERELAAVVRVGSDGIDDKTFDLIRARLFD